MRNITNKKLHLSIYITVFPDYCVKCVFKTYSKKKTLRIL